MREFHIGDLIEAFDRQGRVVRDCGDFVVITVGDPLRHHSRCDVIAVPHALVKHVG